MAQKPTADDARTDEKETSVVDVRTTDLSEFEDGEKIRVHYRDEATEPSETVEGRVEVRYADRKAMIETDDGRSLIVDLRDTASDGGLRDYETGETLGRPMFAETAYHVEKDGHDLRRELLGEDGDDDEDDEDDETEFENLNEGDDVTVRYDMVSDGHTHAFEGVLREIQDGRFAWKTAVVEGDDITIEVCKITETVKANGTTIARNARFEN